MLLRAFIAVGMALALAALGFLKFFADDAARPAVRTAVSALPPKAPIARAAPRFSGPRLPAAPAPRSPVPADQLAAPATDDGVRSAGSTLEGELIRTAQALGRTECEIAGYIETLQNPPTWDGLFQQYARPPTLRAVDQTQRLYEATVALGAAGATLAELHEFYCAANP
jgi:hypothetical protein